MSIVVKLPWPNRNLSPNGRPTRMQLWRLKKEAKTEAFYAAKEALKGGTLNPPFDVRVTYHPPTSNYPDEDNFISSCKAAQDGIAAALGVDDSHFKPHYNDGPVIKGGCVVWQIAEAEE